MALLLLFQGKPRYVSFTFARGLLLILKVSGAIAGANKWFAERKNLVGPKLLPNRDISVVDSETLILLISDAISGPLALLLILEVSGTFSEASTHFFFRSEWGRRGPDCLF